MRRSGVTDCHSQCARWLRNDIDNKRVGSPPKKLAEFAARRRQKIGIIFHRDMRVGENTSQAASVEFCRLRQNYARSSLQSLWQKKQSFFAS